jgi:hypothetical protein
MRKLAILTVALLAALSAGVLAVTAGSGSSHREAPLSSLDPTADDTDVYAYVAPDAPGSVTLTANWIPFEDPAGGPNFYRFDDRASYYLNVDNTGDGSYDIRYRFKFKTKVRNPESFLHALPGVSHTTLSRFAKSIGCEDIGDIVYQIRARQNQFSEHALHVGRKGRARDRDAEDHCARG